MRIEVDEAALPPDPVVPACLQVRNFHGVANALHVRRRVRALRPKNRSYTAAQQVAYCVQKKDIIRLTKVLLARVKYSSLAPRERTLASSLFDVPKLLSAYESFQLKTRREEHRERR